MTSGVPLHNLNTRIFKLGGHWWIDIGVRACHGMSKVTRKQREEYIESDDQLTRKLLFLGADDMSVRTPDGRVLAAEELRHLLELLAQIESTVIAIGRRGIAANQLLLRWWMCTLPSPKPVHRYVWPIPAGYWPPSATPMPKRN